MWWGSEKGMRLIAILEHFVVFGISCWWNDPVESYRQNKVGGYI
jgi:hypothetical protein